MHRPVDLCMEILSRLTSVLFPKALTSRSESRVSTFVAEQNIVKSPEGAVALTAASVE